MNGVTCLDLVISIVSGLCICIPLCCKLVDYVATAARTRNWNQIVALIADLMAQAEKNLTDGTSRKEWVMGQLALAAEEIDYDLNAADMTKISDMIDRLCTMSKVVNTETAETAQTE